MNQNIDNTDFRLMECLNEQTGQIKIVVYAAPEIRQVNPFGDSGRSNVLSANFISDHLILT